MTTMAHYTIETHGRKIQQRFVRNAWRNITMAPMPTVVVFEFEAAEFDRVAREGLEKGGDAGVRWEHGDPSRVTPDGFATATRDGYFVAIRKPVGQGETPETVLRHELEHILNGDIWKY